MVVPGQKKKTAAEQNGEQTNFWGMEQLHFKNTRMKPLKLLIILPHCKQGFLIYFQCFFGIS